MVTVELLGTHTSSYFRTSLFDLYTDVLYTNIKCFIVVKIPTNCIFNHNIYADLCEELMAS